MNEKRFEGRLFHAMMAAANDGYGSQKNAKRVLIRYYHYVFF